MGRTYFSRSEKGTTKIVFFETVKEIWCKPENLQHVIKSATKIIGCDLPSVESIYEKRLVRKAESILKDDTHPGHTFFELLPSGKRYRTIATKTERSRNTFYPCAVKAMSKL